MYTINVSDLLISTDLCLALICAEHYVSNATICVCENLCNFVLHFCHAVLSFISNFHSNMVVNTSLYKVLNYFDVIFFLFIRG